MQSIKENFSINGVIVQPLKKIYDEQGSIMHMLRSDSLIFKSFGEIYFSEIHQGCIKAWRRHLRMTQHFSVPRGNVNIVLYDDRPESPSYGIVQSIETGENNYCLVRVPPLIWYGFKEMSGKTALIANCTDIPHDPSEIERCDFSCGLVPYQWET